MLVIRYQRFSKKNRPFFRIVVTEKSSSPKTGKYVEMLGYLDPLKKVSEVNKERVLYWLDKGAKASDSVYNLLIEKGILQGNKRKIKVKSKKDENQKESKTENVDNSQAS
jgi:small subunit ribosomal protein S16